MTGTTASPSQPTSGGAHAMNPATATAREKMTLDRGLFRFRADIGLVQRAVLIGIESKKMNQEELGLLRDRLAVNRDGFVRYVSSIAIRAASLAPQSRKLLLDSTMPMLDGSYPSLDRATQMCDILKPHFQSQAEVRRFLASLVVLAAEEGRWGSESLTPDWHQKLLRMGLPTPINL